MTGFSQIKLPNKTKRKLNSLKKAIKNAKPELNNIRLSHNYVILMLIDFFEENARGLPPVSEGLNGKEN